MKGLGFFITTLMVSVVSHAHDAYVNGNRLNNAIRAVYSTAPNSGFGGDCFSCHSNVPNIPAAGFGRDIFNRTAALFGNGNTTLSQNQLQTLVNDANLRGTDSDGDSFNNQREFEAGSDPGDQNSTPGVTPTPTPTPTPAPVPSPGGGGGGGPSKLSDGNANANYLNSSGCGISRRSAENVLLNRDTEFATAMGFAGLLIVPFGVFFSLRRRK